MLAMKRNYLLRRLELSRLTHKTITDLDELRASLDNIAKLGYAEDIEEFITGLVAIAVPVHDAAGELRAAVAIHAPNSRISSEELQGMLPHLDKAVRKTSDLL